jgi:hypothetical protein
MTFVIWKSSANMTIVTSQETSPWPNQLGPVLKDVEKKPDPVPRDVERKPASAS